LIRDGAQRRQVLSQQAQHVHLGHNSCDGAVCVEDREAVHNARTRPAVAATRRLLLLLLLAQEHVADGCQHRHLPQHTGQAAAGACAVGGVRH
jgi:hypothetical protein